MAVSIMSYKVLACGFSDVGLVRQNNEDVWGQERELNFYVLADGMGGHQAGEVAAEHTVKELCALIKSSMSLQAEGLSFHDMRKLISCAIQQVNATVYKLSRTEASLRGMGTTLCCLLFHSKGLVYAHVGDSRIYRFRKGKLHQLTKDHSLLCELVEQGQFTEESSIGQSYKNIITKAIGTEPHVEPATHLCDVEDGDMFMMCSDGLSDMLSTKEMQDVFRQGMSVEETAKELIATAKARGGYDNITVVITKVEGHANKDLSR